MTEQPFKQSYDEQSAEETYFAVFKDDGTAGYCSCGRPLVKIDETTYQCSGGYPTYRLDQGDIFIDKFGQLYFRNIHH